MRRMQFSRAVLLCCLWSSTAQCLAQGITRRIDSLVAIIQNRQELNGNILVAANGQPLFKYSCGYANQATGSLNNDSSAFQLASVSKTFTAVAILQLKEKGWLRLDDAVARYLPDFPSTTITIRHLLSHTSGLTDFQVFEPPYHADTNRIFSNADLIPAIQQYEKAFLFKPGEKWSYSNTGYGLLALIVEKASGMRFQDYMAEYIFIPAGMYHTYISTLLAPVADKNRTCNYAYLSYCPSRLRNVDSVHQYKIELVNLGSIIGPGNVISTTGDLLRFDQALYSAKLLNTSSLEEAFTPTRLNDGSLAICGWKKTRAYYGLGWSILCDSTMGKAVFHSGGMQGAVTIFIRNITHHQTVIVLDNVTHRSIHSTGIDLLTLLNNRPVVMDKQSLATLYGEAVFLKGADNATTRFNELKTDTAHYYMDELELNNIGLNLLFDGHTTAALEVLKTNALLYPASWNVYDSYAEALQMAGRKEEAIAMYRKSISLNPGNAGGKKALAALEKQ